MPCSGPVAMACTASVQVTVSPGQSGNFAITLTPISAADKNKKLNVILYKGGASKLWIIDKAPKTFGPENRAFSPYRVSSNTADMGGTTRALNIIIERPAGGSAVETWNLQAYFANGQMAQLCVDATNQNAVVTSFMPIP